MTCVLQSEEGCREKLLRPSEVLAAFWGRVSRAEGSPCESVCRGRSCEAGVWVLSCKWSWEPGRPGGPSMLQLSGRALRETWLSREDKCSTSEVACSRYLLTFMVCPHNGRHCLQGVCSLIGGNMQSRYLVGRECLRIWSLESGNPGSRLCHLTVLP